MKSLTYTLFALLLTANVIAVEIPNQFEDGQVTSASKMNENFQALKAELEAQRALIEANLGNQKVIFQGFSAESMNGGQGMLAMQQACHNLAAGSHVCKDTEIALSQYNPNAQNLEGNAWVIRETGYIGGAGSKYDAHFMHQSPLSLYSNNHQEDWGYQSDHGCRGWRTNSENYRGAKINSILQFDSENCNVQQKVACCK